MLADLQTAIDALFSRDKLKFFGIRQHYRHDTLNFAKLCDERDDAYSLAAWLGSATDFPYVVVLSPHYSQDEAPAICIEITVPEGADGADFVQRCFAEFEAAVSAARAYRGKILSFEGGSDYSGRSRCLTVHRAAARRARRCHPAGSDDKAARSQCAAFCRNP